MTQPTAAAAATNEADIHIEAAVDILDFIDGSGTGDDRAITSAIVALTHATLAVARAIQAGRS